MLAPLRAAVRGRTGTSTFTRPTDEGKRFTSRLMRTSAAVYLEGATDSTTAR
jgi:hypothetical protein